MDVLHFHLLVNHFPIIGAYIGTLVLIVGMFLRLRDGIRQTGLAILVFSALMSIPAYFTGEESEHMAEEIPGVTEAFIEPHEDQAKLFMIGMIATGVLAAAALIAPKFTGKPMQLLGIVVAGLALVSCFLAAQAGNSGGQIRHTEIRTGNNASANAADANTDTGSSTSEHENHEDH